MPIGGMQRRLVVFRTTRWMDEAAGERRRRQGRRGGGEEKVARQKMEGTDFIVEADFAWGLGLKEGCRRGK